MNQILKKRLAISLGLALVLGLIVFGWVGPVQADGGGWATETPTPTNVPPTSSPIDLFFTPEPAIIVPDTGGSGVRFGDELATLQFEVQLTTAAQSIMLTPTPTPFAISGSPMPFLGLGVVIMIGVIVFIGTRFFRRNGA